MKQYSTMLIAAGIGAVNALILLVFEFIGIEMTAWLWYDVFRTGEYNWLKIPLAAVLSGICMTIVLKMTKSKRVVSPEHNLMAEMDEHPKPTIITLVNILAVGAMSLLAGASLGPEAALMTASIVIGTYAANKWQNNPQKQTLVLASVGSLLVAFIGSLLLLLIPILLLFQMNKKAGKGPQIMPIVAIIAAGAASLITLEIIHGLTHTSGGYGTIPPLPAPAPHDLIVAVVVGFIAAFLSLFLNWSINHIWRGASSLQAQKIPGIDWIAGTIFGLALGVVYYIGGPTIEFSGSIGSHVLVEQSAQLSVAALFGLMLSKIAATALSKGTGYRGGTVFPSIYIGLAFGLMINHLFPEIGGAGALVGAICGTVTAALGSPIIAGIFLIALLPSELWPIAASAVVGVLLFGFVSKQVTTNHKRKATA